LGAIHGAETVRLDRRLALFLGVAFFVKYSFEHNLISPELRIAIGLSLAKPCYAASAFKTKENAVTAQTLCASRILVLYAVTFCLSRLLHFAFFGLIPTFLLIDVNHGGRVSARRPVETRWSSRCSELPAFSHSVLLSTGERLHSGLFVYIALLDVGLLAVAQRQRWNALSILGALGTALMQFAWVTTFFVPEKYFAGNKVLVAMECLPDFRGCFSRR